MHSCIFADKCYFFGRTLFYRGKVRTPEKQIIWVLVVFVLSFNQENGLFFNPAIFGGEEKMLACSHVCPSGDMVFIEFSGGQQDGRVIFDLLTTCRELPGIFSFR